jgi:sporulation protein YlmC with PRC-barrel domain
MMLRYTQLRGLPVRTSDGATLGRLADLAIEERAGEALCTELHVMPNAILMLLNRLGHWPDGHVVPARDVAHVDPAQVVLRHPRSRYERG